MSEQKAKSRGNKAELTEALRHRIDQALTYLLRLKLDREDGKAFLNFLQAIQEIKASAKNLGMTNLLEHVEETEWFLTIVKKGKLTVTPEIVHSFFESLQTIRALLPDEE